MRYGVLLLGDRIAPRTMAADSLLLLTVHRNRLLAREAVPFHADTWVELYEELHGYHVQALVCGGIANETRRILQTKKLNIIDNVACTAEEAVNAIVSRTLVRGYGFERPLDRNGNKGSGVATDGIRSGRPAHPMDHERSKDRGHSVEPGHPIEPGQMQGNDGEMCADHGEGRPLEDSGVLESSSMDCLACEDRRCLRGEGCLLASLQPDRKPEKGGGQDLPEIIDADELRSILDAATDISAEKERILCRVSELVYFCLEMEYRKIGIAFCMDLIDPARTLATLLERFFEVYPVGCKIGGKAMDDPFSPAPVPGGGRTQVKVACNPMGQAAALNRINTDLNVIVGLCMGHDCIFNRVSHAPVTTLFVKDRSLANNPIGAMYSEYYLREVSKAPAFRP